MFDYKMDAHMHFDLYNDRQAVIDYISAQKSYTSAVTNLPDIYKRYVNKYDNNPYLKIALGFHPELCTKYANQLSLFKALCDTTRFIGEIGLDYSNTSDHDTQFQKRIFDSILNYCTGNNKILSIHSRKAESDVLSSLKDFEGKVILHWYSGSLSNIDISIERGYYFSINHQMLKSKTGKRIISKIPVNRILLESDAPFTAGMQEEYSTTFMDYVYDYISSLYNQDINTVKKRIKANFMEILT